MSAVTSPWMSAAELLASDLKLEYLWNPFMIREGVVALTGPSDCGKSRLLRQLALAVVQKQPAFLGFPLQPKTGRAYYIATEESQPALKMALQQETANEQEGLTALEFIFEADNLWNRLDQKLSEQPADLVILDTWSDTFLNNPNSFVDVRQDLLQWRALARKHSCLIVLVHHNSKYSENYIPDKNRANGSQAFEATVRCLLELREGYEPDERYLTILKHNYLGKEEKSITHILELRKPQLTFVNTGRTLSKGMLVKEDKHVYDRGFWCPLMRSLRKEGKSYETAHLQLVAEYGNAKTPGLTWFKKTCKDQSGQSDTTLESD